MYDQRKSMTEMCGTELALASSGPDNLRDNKEIEAGGIGKFMYDLLGDTAKEVSDHVDSLLVEGCQALATGDRLKFLRLSREVMECQKIISSIRMYLTSEHVRKFGGAQAAVLCVAAILGSV